MPYIELYENQECTQLYGAFPAHKITYGNLSGSVVNVTVSGKTYPIFGYVDNPPLIRNASVINANPPFSSVKNRYPNGKTFYLKNGLRFTVTEKTTGYNKIGDSYIGTQRITREAAMYATTNDIGSVFFVETIINNTIYYGFTFFYINQSNATITPMLLSTADFWEGTFRPDYSYGEDAEQSGGQATGTMPNTGVHRSTNPTGGIPVGGRGLHTYIITPSGYQSLQSFLWGEGDTLAKSLWQKFLNKTHNPANCVIACFRLPSAFMPSSSVSSGVQLAGVNLPVTGATAFDAYTNNYSTATISLGTPEPPFDSWLDYSGVTCKIGVPFCGEIAVPAEKVYNKEVVIKYRCDWFNGNLGAAVFADSTIIADLTGNCAYNIPVSGGDTGTLDRIGALATGILQIAAAETGAAAVAGVATAAAGVAGAQYKTYLNNSNISGSVNSTMNGVAYIEFIVPTTAYSKYQNKTTYIQAYGLPAPAASGVIGDFAGGYGEFDVCKYLSIFLPNCTEAEKNEIIQMLSSGVIV